MEDRTELTPERVLVDQSGDFLRQNLDLVLEQGQQLIDRCQYRDVMDEAALVALGSAYLSKLAQACDQRTAMLLVGSRRH